jgi:pimeloyl-ACP methyl ester carboxylesterase
MPKTRANNITLNYERDGTGEPLILIPYLTADHACYAFQVAEYAKQFTCISLDLRGAGESDKPDGVYSTQQFADDVAAFMQAIGVGRAHVSGLSLGAATTAGVGARVLRLMREAHLLAPMRVGQAHGPKAHDGTITTDQPDQMWGMDATSCLTREGTATVFVVGDHCAAECIGLHSAKPGTASRRWSRCGRGVHALFGGYEAGIARGLQARHDHGSQYMSDYFQAELKFLGIGSSPAFMREPEGNGVAERFIRTLKEDLRQALLEFKDRYNRAWLCERHGHQTPAQVRARLLELAA